MISSANWNDSLQQGIFRWTGGAVFAVALHVGLLAFLLHSTESTDADIAGAIAIDLAPITAGPPAEMADVPPGPLTPEQTAASEAKMEIPKQETVETPSVEPSPLAPNPEITLPPKRAEEKQEPVEKEKVEHTEHESQASEAVLPTAPPRVEGNNAVVSAARSRSATPASAGRWSRTRRSSSSGPA